MMLCQMLPTAMSPSSTQSQGGLSLQELRAVTPTQPSSLVSHAGTAQTDPKIPKSPNAALGARVTMQRYSKIH